MKNTVLRMITVLVLVALALMLVKVAGWAQTTYGPPDPVNWPTTEWLLANEDSPWADQGEGVYHIPPAYDVSIPGWWDKVFQLDNTCDFVQVLKAKSGLAYKAFYWDTAGMSQEEIAHWQSEGWGHLNGTDWNLCQGVGYLTWVNIEPWADETPDNEPAVLSFTSTAELLAQGPGDWASHGKDDFFIPPSWSVKIAGDHDDVYNLDDIGYPCSFVQVMQADSHLIYRTMWRDVTDASQDEVELWLSQRWYQENGSDWNLCGDRTYLVWTNIEPTATPTPEEEWMIYLPVVVK